MYDSTSFCALTKRELSTFLAVIDSPMSLMVRSGMFTLYLALLLMYMSYTTCACASRSDCMKSRA